MKHKGHDFIESGEGYDWYCWKCRQHFYSMEIDDEMPVCVPVLRPRAETASEFIELVEEITEDLTKK